MSHVAYQRIGRNDDEPEDEGSLEPCVECDGAGEIVVRTPAGMGCFEQCLHCNGKGYFLNDEPCSKSEYEKLTESYPS